MNVAHAPVYAAASVSPALDAPVPIPVREVLPWAVFIGLIL